MKKMDYAEKILQLQKDYPEELCKNGVWVPEDFDYLTSSDVRNLYQVQLNVLWEKRPELRS